MAYYWYIEAQIDLDGIIMGLGWPFVIVGTVVLFVVFIFLYLSLKEKK